jgi:hypothetical protein
LLCSSISSFIDPAFLPLFSIQVGLDDFAVLGNVFNKNHAITFHYGGGPSLANRSIGFANRKDTGIVIDSSGIAISS